MNRQKIADIIDRQSHTDRIGAAYDWFMVLAILVSLLPLMFMKSHEAFWYTELGSTLVFIIDYLLRWGTADIRNNNRKTAFLTYPFSFMAIIDLLSILPAITLLNPAFKLFRFVRLLRLTRVLKVFPSLFGIAVIALPSGVITARYLDELRRGRHSEV